MDGAARDPAAAAGEGEGSTPFLELEGFSGPLQRLLDLARAQRIDLARISLRDFADQLAAALCQAVPLGQKADWLVMAAWLALLRSRLLLPAETPAQQAAEQEMQELRGHLATRQEVQALAAWLERRPRLGRDVFARGRPELFGTAFEARHEVDVIAFLWACLALFDDAPPEAAGVYRPSWLDLHSIPEARARILRLLAAAPEGLGLDRLLPEAGEGASPPGLRRRSAWTSTFIASLELARQGEAALEQAERFAPILVRPGGSSAGTEPDSR